MVVALTSVINGGGARGVTRLLRIAQRGPIHTKRGLAVRTKAVRHKRKNLREKAMPLKARGVNITRPRSFREPGPIEENHGF